MNGQQQPVPYDDADPDIARQFGDFFHGAAVGEGAFGDADLASSVRLGL